ncbi:MAG: DNA cytosine methyltransferase [Verrucomicrobiota bacterium]|nr:DNA cytosine methyltransferase [Verrucomicrobiota bacterium]
MPDNSPTFIDLFCGCGGFSLGLLNAGFTGLAALDFNPQAIQVYKKNLHQVPHILERDLTQFPPLELEKLIGHKTVDVIVGGPPCQGFSTSRQVDGANHGERMVDDPRRHLYREFLKYVVHFQPKVFIIENVLGIRSAAGGEYFTKVQKEARALGYRVSAKVEECVKLGIPQKRRRQLFFGTREDLPNYLYGNIQPPRGLPSSVTLWEAIGDLPPLKAGEGEEDTDYDLDRRWKHEIVHSSKYLRDVLEIDKSKRLTAHRARPHSARDLGDFAKLEEGESSANAIKRNVEFDFPYNRETFKDRYTRQHRDKPCSTIVAHLGKDGLMFIHPTQNRSLTPREAARIQSFPDWFEFPVARTHQFRVIGNAVPPLVSEAIGIAVNSYLEKVVKKSNRIKFLINPLPKDNQQALAWLLPLVNAADCKSLRKVSTDDFKRGWYSVGFLYPGLHPDGALEHGAEISDEIDDPLGTRKVEPRLLAPFYVESGWPVVLAPVAKEAWRRFEAEELKDDEFYCSEAVAAGMVHRCPDLADGVREERSRLYRGENTLVVQSVNPMFA